MASFSFFRFLTSHNTLKMTGQSISFSIARRSAPIWDDFRLAIRLRERIYFSHTARRRHPSNQVSEAFCLQFRYSQDQAANFQRRQFWVKYLKSILGHFGTAFRGREFRKTRWEGISAKMSEENIYKKKNEKKTHGYSRFVNGDSLFHLHPHQI